MSVPIIFKNYFNEYIGCGGRAIEKKTFAKYINTPETAFYKKGENLYNYNILFILLLFKINFKIKLIKLIN